jgi:hypothetical protein
VNANQGSVAAVNNLANDNSVIYDGDITAAGAVGSLNANSGIAEDSVIGNQSAWFNNVGVGTNNSTLNNSDINNTQNTLLNAR